MCRTILFSILTVFLSLFAGATKYELKSPDGNIVVNVSVDNEINYSVSFNGEKIINPSTLGFTFRQAPPLGNNLKILSSKVFSTDETWTPVLKRFDKIRNNYNNLRLESRETKFPQRKMTVEFRAFNDGVAFRIEFPEQFGERENVITDELTQFNFSGDFTCWAVNYGSYATSQEVEFFERKIGDIKSEMVIGLPMTAKVSNECYVAITEAALVDYAGMYLKADNRSDGLTLRSALAPVKGQAENGDKVVFKTPHKTPWRVVMIGDAPGKLVESEIVQNLNEPCAIEDPSWIKPRRSAWDHWWSGEVKMEQSVIFEYIDLAASMGWPYMLIDWQWYGEFNPENADIKTVAPQLNMSEILDYAKSKNVKCWLLMYNTDVDRYNFEEACALYEKWGIAGIKIDFMDSDAQTMVNWYHRVVKTAAKYHLMVDFHGAYKPTGWRRTYPNLMTREGVMGNEYNKWSLRVTPEHMCTLPFTRMLAGPMDFTPGGFLNRNPDKFLNGTPANVLGTRCNTLAQFVIYDSPYTVACDHPDNYKGEVGVEFLQKVQAIWDDTKVLNGAISEYITMARRSGKNWFVGAMTNSEARELEITLDFLPEGKFKMTSFSDTEKIKQDAESAQKTELTVEKEDSVKIKMQAGGGFAAVFEPVE
ncbi:glycoside hydrolase family 97 protein [Prolixibacteraceae bacterium Z1-6]|uniref:Glycoside hydrolase family 97 protein n=1 Tax=Draconibacterium aestuarii TaxID=2998507 RepID=A0A9X3J7R7_9BACT|nr:glycoside hydrolase family 97 protein [Prolixibacteraceae bacterium Z1-6]